MIYSTEYVYSTQFGKKFGHDADDSGTFPEMLQNALDNDGNHTLPSKSKAIKKLFSQLIVNKQPIKKGAVIKEAVLTHVSGGLAATFLIMQEFEVQYGTMPQNGFPEEKIIARLEHHTYMCDRALASEDWNLEFDNGLENEMKRYAMYINLPYYHCIRQAILDRARQSIGGYAKPDDGLEIPR